TVVVNFPNAGAGQDSAQVVVTDGTTQVASPSQTYGTTNVSFQGLDVTAMVDGVVDVQVVLTDVNLNTSSATFHLTKDTVAPAGAVAAQIPNGGSSPSDTINIATVANVTTLMAIAADVEARTVVATFSDGVTT